jgi:NitT/TauT family transport system substrate-binding protein
MTGVWRLNRRAALALGLAAPLLVPVARRPRAQTVDRLSFNTDWRAQAEHGGYYQAIAAGIYRKHGIECDLRPGGPSLNISQLLLAGRVDMIMSNSYEAFTYLREKAPFFTIAAIFQKDPQVLIAHPEFEGTTFADLAKLPTIFMGKDLFSTGFSG